MDSSCTGQLSGFPDPTDLFSHAGSVCTTGSQRAHKATVQCLLLWVVLLGLDWAIPASMAIFRGPTDSSPMADNLVNAGHLSQPNYFAGINTRPSFSAGLQRSAQDSCRSTVEASARRSEPLRDRQRQLHSARQCASHSEFIGAGALRCLVLFCCGLDADHGPGELSAAIGGSPTFLRGAGSGRFVHGFAFFSV